MSEQVPARRRWWLAAAALAVVVLASSPLWGPRVVSGMSFFRLRSVEIRGARHVHPADVVARLEVDTATSVWTDLRPLEERVAAHPQVESVRITRKLPGTLVVHVTENLPVAYVPAREGLRPVDALARPLPIDPSRTAVDLPVAATADTMLLRLLAAIREDEPALFSRISEIRRVGRDEVLLRLPAFRVRAMADVTIGRLAELTLVEADLARRRAEVVELDLRYRDQVIARVQ